MSVRPQYLRPRRLEGLDLLQVMKICFCLVRLQFLIWFYYVYL